MLLGISGLAGSGKDTVGDILCNGTWAKCALADPLKRIARDIYAFTDEQLWGPSYKRNELDKRYPRQHTWRRSEGEAGRHTESKCACCGQNTTLRQVEDDVWVENEGEDCGVSQCFLTPRYALQHIGTEHGRHCFENIWIDYALRTHDKLQKGGCSYDQKVGLRWHSSFEGETWVKPKQNVIITDCRFKNELQLIQAAGGRVIRITRAGVEAPAWMHKSETEQMEIPDDQFDYIVRNDGTLEDLERIVQEMSQKLAV